MPEAASTKNILEDIRIRYLVNWRNFLMEGGTQTRNECTERLQVNQSAAGKYEKIGFL